MPMKPTTPESLKGLAGREPARARLLDDDEVDEITAAAEDEDDEEDEK